MSISISTICENTAGVGLLGEWGLSLLLEVEGCNILFDAGGRW